MVVEVEALVGVEVGTGRGLIGEVGWWGLVGAVDRRYLAVGVNWTCLVATACIAIRHCHLVDVPCLWPSTLF